MQKRLTERKKLGENTIQENGSDRIFPSVQGGRPGNRELHVVEGQDIVLTESMPAMAPTHTCIQSDSPVTAKGSEHEANPSPLSIPEVKNAWNYTFTPLHVFNASCAIKDRENADMAKKDRKGDRDRKKKKEEQRNKIKRGRNEHKLKTTRNTVTEKNRNLGR